MSLIDDMSVEWYEVQQGGSSTILCRDHFGLDALALDRQCEYRLAVEFISELLTEGTQGFV